MATARVATAAQNRRSPVRSTGALAIAAAGSRRLGATPGPQVTGSNLLCVRDHNQLLVLHMIRTRGASTRRDLSGLTGLTFQTIENISRRLIDVGVLVDVPPATAAGRSRRLVLRPDGANVIGIEVAPGGCRIVLCDMSGHVVADRQLAGDTTSSARVVELLAEAVPDMIDAAEVRVTAVLGIGLATAVDQRGIRDDIERRLGMPTLWTSAVVAGARGEQWCGGLSTRDFVYVHLGADIDCAIVSRGQLCTGARGRGGAIAHIPVERSGKQRSGEQRSGEQRSGETCDCGRRGCLTAVLSERALRRAVAAALGVPEPPVLPTLEDVARLAASDERVAGCVELAATHLADALLPAVQLLDPEVIMIGGPLADALGPLLRSVVERRAASMELGCPGPAIRLARPGAGGAAGTARVVLHETFTPAMSHLVLDTVAV